MIIESRIHSVIFDLDGTLADSAILTTAAFAQVMPEFGLPVPDVQTIKKAIGYANPEFYYMLFPNFPRETVFKAGAKVEETELKILSTVSGKILFEGCHEMLSRLKESGIRLHIASTGDYDHVHGILSAAKIHDLFESVSCGRPDKIEMLREIIDPRSKNGYIMVGDMSKDYYAAYANGILSVGARYGYCREDDLGFDMYIDSPHELLSLVR